jgi:hypothetical protein
MTRQEAVALIDNHKNALINPVELINWTWLRVIINSLSDEAWEAALEKGLEVLSR